MPTHFGFDTTKKRYASGKLDAQDKQFIRLAALDIFTDAIQVEGLLTAFAGRSYLDQDVPEGEPDRLKYPRPSDTERTKMLEVLEARVKFATDTKRNEVSDAFMARRLHEKLVAWASHLGPLKSKEIGDIYVAYFVKERLSKEIKAKKSAVVKLHQAVLTTKNTQQSKFQSPDDIKRVLDEYVIGQDSAKRSISFALYLHLLRHGRVDLPIRDSRFSPLTTDTIPRLPSPNLLVVGSTGSGKTYSIKTACRLVGVDFLAVDCSSLTSAGYKGTGLEDVLAQFLRQCDGDVSRVESGVLYFDEFDKLAFGDAKADHGGAAVQRELLTFVEGSKRIVASIEDAESTKVTIDTTNILCVFGGSFAGIEKDMAQSRSFGYARSLSQESDEHSWLNRLQASDLIRFGIIPELMGRINYIEGLRPLGAVELRRILVDSAESPLSAYEAYFRLHLDILDVRDDALTEIAALAAARRSGGRGIVAVLQHLFADYLFAAPNTEQEVFVIDKVLVETLLVKGSQVEQPAYRPIGFVQHTIVK